MVVTGEPIVISFPSPSPFQFSHNGPKFSKDAKASDPSKHNDVERQAAAIPGPGEYPLPSSISKGVPAYGFGTSTRGSDGTLAALREEMRAGQAPALYRVYGSVGKQLDSGKRSMPSFGFGTSSRFNRAGANNNPGPGSYVC